MALQNYRKHTISSENKHQRRHLTTWRNKIAYLLAEERKIIGDNRILKYRRHKYRTLLTEIQKYM